MADTGDLKSPAHKACGFESRQPHSKRIPESRDPFTRGKRYSPAGETYPAESLSKLISISSSTPVEEKTQPVFPLSRRIMYHPSADTSRIS